jgi:hypothetical protein
MAEIKGFPPARLVCGVISARDAAFERAEARLAEAFGEIASRSPRFPFDFTDYYEPEMGPGLRRGFVAFRSLVDPSTLAAAKIRTNALEREISAELGGGAGGRPVNLDPGCLTSAALIMATAKDFAHRIPMRDGIYGHLELLFTRAGVRLLDWTYPDFGRPGVQAFFIAERRRLLADLRARG